MININIAVNTVAALSQRTLHGNAFIMDDSIYDSSSQGSDHLTTHCLAGDQINWIIYSIDLQTPISLTQVAFNQPSCGTSQPPPFNNLSGDAPKKPFDPNQDPDRFQWAGYVPYHMASGVKYPYQLTIQIGQGIHSILTLEAASLVRL